MSTDQQQPQKAESNLPPSEKAVNSFFTAANSCSPSPLPWMEDRKFTLVTSLDMLTKHIDRAIEIGLCALDTETQGLDTRIDGDGRTFHSIVGYCFSYDVLEGFYVPVRHLNPNIKDRYVDGKGMSEANLPAHLVDLEFKRLVESCRIVYHNSCFDQEMLFGSSAKVPDPKPSQFEDTQLLSYLADSTSKRHGLKHLSKTVLGLEMHELKEFYPRAVKTRDFSHLDPTDPAVVRYATSDAIATLALYEVLKEHGAGPQHAVYQVEKALVPALRWLERNRMTVDLDYMRRLEAEVSSLISNTVDEIYRELAVALKITQDEVEKRYVITSPEQLGKALADLQRVDRSFAKVQLETTEKSGQVKTDMAAMDTLVSRYSEKFPFLALVSKMRSLQKVLGTYIKPIIQNTLPRDSTIRFSFDPWRVDTGRFSASKGVNGQGYSGVNVQSVPGTYVYMKALYRTVHSRPSGSGLPSDLSTEVKHAVDTGFTRLFYDGHFMSDLESGEELCFRASCEGCPFEHDCQHDNPKKKVFYSVGSAIRPGLVSPEGFVTVSIDFSGVELRVVANVSEEPRWLDEFYRCGSCGHGFEKPVRLKKGVWEIKEVPPTLCPTCGSDKIGDLHTLTAQIVWGDDVVNLPSSEFKRYRQMSKGVNFSIIYGGGGNAIASACGVDSKEGYSIKNKFMAGLPVFSKWVKSTISKAHKTKEVRTALGRKIPLHDINSEVNWIKAKQERNVVNSIVQGSATGDLIKYAMGLIYKEVKDRRWLSDCKMVLTMHDELVFEVRQSMLDEVIPVLNHCMTIFGERKKWPVPLMTDVEFNTSWSPNYNWTLMHAIHPKTRLAEEGVPGFLVDTIKFYNGMWYTDPETGDVLVWHSSSKAFLTRDAYQDLTAPTSDSPVSDNDNAVITSQDEGVSKEASAPPEDPKGAEGLAVMPRDITAHITGMPPKKTAEPSVSAVHARFPVYKHKALVALSGATVGSYMLRLKRVADSCKILTKMKIMTPTHTLRVYDIQGNEVTDPDKVIEIDPAIFNALAYHEGL